MYHIRFLVEFPLETQSFLLHVPAFISASLFKSSARHRTPAWIEMAKHLTLKTKHCCLTSSLFSQTSDSLSKHAEPTRSTKRCNQAVSTRSETCGATVFVQGEHISYNSPSLCLLIVDYQRYGLKGANQKSELLVKILLEHVMNLKPSPEEA